MNKLEEVIRVAQAAVDATPENHPDRAFFPSRLGDGLGERYSSTGSMDHRQEAIRIGQAVVDATPEDHPDRAVFLNSL